MNPPNERQALLVPHRERRSNSLVSMAESLRSIKDYVKDKAPSITTLKFIAAIIWALFAMIVFNLIFLPRTSLARDYRRIHFSTLSKDETERLFLKALRDENHIKEYLYQYSNISSISKDGHQEKIDYTIKKFKQFGFSPYTKKHYTYHNEPVDTSLSLLDNNGDIKFEASFNETGSLGESPVFHAYSASGNVTGEYVYLNYGSIEDYQLLKENFVNVTGKIHIIRHGKLTKGIKLQNAENEGAIGVVFYSDPYDDGYITEKNGFKQYPEGPARNPRSIERGSVSRLPGDPSTPNFSCGRFCRRKDPSEYLAKIPSLPISQLDAEEILKTLNQGVNLNWTGDLSGFDYSVGSSGQYTLNLYNEQNYEISPITNIFYEIPGLSREKIIIGSHRDSLTNNGAGDPNSASAVLLEISRAFGYLIEKGWKPQRTIVVASFDGEEYGKLGSTEYAEANEKDLKNNVVAYLNLDKGVIGPKLKISSNPLLETFLKRAGELVPYKNDPSYSIVDLWKDQSDEELDTTSGYSTFQYHLGIPSCMIYFGSNETSAIYHKHSEFDSIDWIEEFIDPDYQLHGTLAAYAGFAALSFSEHEVIEYKTLHYTSFIKENFDKYIDDIPKSWLDLKVKPKKQILPLTEYINTVNSTLNQLIKTSTKFDQTAAELQRQISIDYPWFRSYKKLMLAINIKVIDTKSNQLDRMFLYEPGLKDRSYLRHILLAPNKENGIEEDALPGLHEAIKDHDIDEFVKWLRILEEYTHLVNKNLKV